jgi:hypothetical protein
MKVSTSRPAAILAVAATVASASRTCGAAVIGLAILALLIYVGIALPAVWSAKPARRKAAAEVLRQILSILRK